MRPSITLRLIPMAADDAKLSKFLSLVLRHQPETIGLTLDAHGWASIDELVRRSNDADVRLAREDLLRIVATSDKKRFSLSDDGKSIRAAQGHSVAVHLALTPRVPPDILYHGTATRFLPAILAEGLQPRSRQQVHLSADEATARSVGQRHGKPIVLVVAAQQMHARGAAFFQADNGVWLTDRVPPEFLSVR